MVILFRPFGKYSFHLIAFRLSKIRHFKANKKGLFLAL